MSDVVTAAVAYIDRRLATMKRAPKSWGSPESLELQALLLLELRTFLLRRRTHASDPYEVRDAYARFLARHFPELPGRFMAHALPAEKLAEQLPDLVMALRDEVVSTLGPEDAFQTAALVVEVRFRPGVATPPFAKAARYVGRLLRAMGVVVGSTGGRARDAVFAIPDVRFVPSDDETGPGVLFAFDAPQGTPAAVTAHWQALEKMARVVEWAASGEGAGAAPLLAMFPEQGERDAVVRCAKRLYPRRAIASVTIGGRGLGRAPIVVEARWSYRIDELLALSKMDFGVPEGWFAGEQQPLPAAPPRLAAEAAR